MSLAAINEDDAADRMHGPVMVEEVCGLLSAHGPLAFVDVTVGTGGHAEAMLRTTSTRMLGLDRDAAALAVARERPAEYGGAVTPHPAGLTEPAPPIENEAMPGRD